MKCRDPRTVQSCRHSRRWRGVWNLGTDLPCFPERVGFMGTALRALTPLILHHEGGTASMVPYRHSGGSSPRTWNLALEMRML